MSGYEFASKTYLISLSKSNNVNNGYGIRERPGHNRSGHIKCMMLGFSYTSLVGGTECLLYLQFVSSVYLYTIYKTIKSTRPLKQS